MNIWFAETSVKVTDSYTQEWFFVAQNRNALLKSSVNCHFQNKNIFISPKYLRRIIYKNYSSVNKINTSVELGTNDFLCMT